MNYSLNAGVTPSGVSTSVPFNNHNFPAAVLQRIFGLIIQGPVVFPLSTQDGRRILAQVCRRWREVVTSTSVYWGSFIFVPLDSVQPPQSLSRLAQASSFLRRSGESLPLTIWFLGSLQSNVSRMIFELVIQSYGHRLCFLSCVVTRSEFTTFFRPQYVDFPLLQRIDVEVRDTDGQFSTRLPGKGSINLSGFKRAPFLRHVALRIPVGVHPGDLRLSWGQLTRINLGNTPMGPRKFIKIMEQSVALEDGVFRVIFARPSNGQFPTLRTIIVPLLRRLHLRLVHPSYDAPIFQHLRMPSLEEVWLEREEVGQWIRDMDLYEKLLARLNAPLKHVTLSEHSVPMTTWFIPRVHLSPRLTYQELDGVFRSAQNLTSLYLCPGVFMGPLVLEHLASGEFLPLLESLGVSSVNGWDIVWMVQEKNLASTGPESSNSSMAPTAPPVALNYLQLFVMGCSFDEGGEQELSDALGALRLSCGFSLKYTDILWREESSTS